MRKELLDILFIGDSWQGASDRSMREALVELRNANIADISRDHFLPRYRTFPMRCLNRVIRPLQVAELELAVRKALTVRRPDIVVIYKGSDIDGCFIRELQSKEVPVVNIFPDHSPNAYGDTLKEALGCYDLVISTKPHHPEMWTRLYGYENPCIHIPHGYDPDIHYWPEPAGTSIYDVAICATWRPEYHRLMLDLADLLEGERFSVTIAGSGWTSHAKELPASWQIIDFISGRAYGDFLRSAKIVVAPVTRDVVVDGVVQPGDQDTTRSYELAAMQCFFLHQRTPYIATVYDERTEVPCWDDARELAALIRRWLPDESGRQAMASCAHSRAVPAYSIPERAKSVHAALYNLVIACRNFRNPP